MATERTPFWAPDPDRVHPRYAPGAVAAPPPAGPALHLPPPDGATGVIPPRRLGQHRPAAAALPAPSSAGAAAARATRRGRIALVLAAAGLVLVTSMAVWGSVPVWSTPGGPATAAGSVAAMTGTYLCLVLLLLVARLPWIEREVGHPVLVALHRQAAPYAVGLICAHVVLTTAGYALAEERGWAAQLVALVLHAGWMLPALAAFVLLVALSVLSYHRLRARLRYETWWVAHLYLYLAVALAFGHQLENSTFLSDQPWLKWTWTALYVVVFALVAGTRLALPAARSWRHGLRVSAVVRESDDAVSVHIAGRGLDRLGARGGQFFQWRFLTRGWWWQAHPYSLSATPAGDSLRITVKAVGDHTAGLPQLRPGTRVWAEGPYGVFTADRRATDRVVAFAAGIGIAPVLAMLQDLPASTDVDVVVRARSAGAAPLVAELEALADERGFRVWFFEGTRRQAPLRTDSVLGLIPDLADSDVYICGPEGFTDRVLSIAERAGVSGDRIHHESFAF